jgi:hypothetical protein
MEHLILYTSPYPKTRIGRPHDGGYVTAILPGTYDALLSGGIANDISFEEHFLQLHPHTPCYAFDGTIARLPRDHPSITFVKKNLGDSNSDELTNLHDYMAPYENIFMKMDIEGHEFRVMPTIQHMKKIKQLVIEIHSPGDIRMFPDYFKGLHDIDNHKMFDLLRSINQTHTLVHFHANNGCAIQEIDGIRLPHVFELTYVRNEFVLEKRKNTTPLPTSLDMKNIPQKEDYFLSGFPYSTMGA